MGRAGRRGGVRAAGVGGSRRRHARTARAAAFLCSRRGRRVADLVRRRSRRRRDQRDRDGRAGIAPRAAAASARACRHVRRDRVRRMRAGRDRQTAVQERSLAGQRRCRSRCRCRRRFATARTGRRAADGGRHAAATRGRRGARRNRRRRRRTTDHELESGRAADLRDRCRCSRRAGRHDADRAALAAAASGADVVREPACADRPARRAVHARRPQLLPRDVRRVADRRCAGQVGRLVDDAARSARTPPRRTARPALAARGARRARAGGRVEPDEGRTACDGIARTAHAAQRDLRLGRGAAQRRRPGARAAGGRRDRSQRALAVAHGRRSARRVVACDRPAAARTRAGRSRAHRARNGPRTGGDRAGETASCSRPTARCRPA